MAFVCPSKGFSSYAGFLDYLANPDGVTPVVPSDSPINPDTDDRKTMVLPKFPVDASVALKAYLEVGGKLHLPDGDYLVDQPMAAYISKTIDVLLDADAKIISGNIAGPAMTIFIDQSNLAAVADGIDITWCGGQYDFSHSKNSTTGFFQQLWAPVDPSTVSSTDGLYIRGSYGGPLNNRSGFRDVVICDGFWTSGEHWETAGGDSHIVVQGAQSTKVFGNTFVGSTGSSVYLTGEIGLVSKNGHVYNNKFYNSTGAVTIKREYTDFIVEDNYIENCIRGVHIGSITGPCEDGEIRNNEMVNVGMGVRLDESINVAVVNNTNTSAGFTEADGTPPDSAFSYVSDGSLRFIDPTTVYTIDAVDCAIVSNKTIGLNPAYGGVGNATTVLLTDGTSDTLIDGNLGDSVYNTVIEDATCFSNVFTGNQAVNNATADTILGTP